ncbi:hypothetical protein ACA910_008630 [Epithemia clementina (nom. ined.)]
MVAQGTAARLNRLRRVLMHCNDMVFRPNDDDDVHTARREPMSVKKFQRGDACWSTFKTILGWNVDTLRGTIELPPHRRQRLLDLLHTTMTKMHITVNTCQKLLGELRSMALGIPGGRGLFSQLQAALAAAHARPLVRLSRPVHDQLADRHVLAQDLCQRPTRIAEIVPSTPSFFGACDAAPVGLGGVWFPSSHLAPIVWRLPTPPVLAPLLTTSEHHGTISINDLELAASLAHADILARAADVRERTLATFSDNVSVVTWNRKGSRTTTGPAAYLLRNISLH